MLDRRKFIKDTTLTAGVLLNVSIPGSRTNINDSEKTQAPFLHGVASGDPLSTQVIIWTRIATDNEHDIAVAWNVAKDEACEQIVQSGQATTNAASDYTIKTDIQRLSPSTIYYYQFTYNNIKSPVGRMKTTPAEGFDNLQFAIVSCSDYSAGYFNALARISERKDLDAVIHLGDYIYEGTGRNFDGSTGDDGYESTHFNRTKEWWLHYYRMRYSISRLDPDLQAAHQAHPFITVWDDHEIANNAWKNGAQGQEDPRDGDWEIRKNIAKQVYAEWMPIRGNASKIYRSIRFGKLAELILLDTRLEGRDQQIYDYSSPALLAPDRTILGAEQKQWLFNQLENSPCLWKLIGSQVVFSEFNVQWATKLTDKVKQLQDTLLDYWEGYPAERDQIMAYLSKRKKNNVIILSASMHCALAFDVTKRATRYSREGEARTYDPASGEGSLAVEFAAPSITSANFDDVIGKFYANNFQTLINKKLPPPLDYNPNPHLKYADLQRHGYIILSLTNEKAEANFYFVEDLFKRNKKEQRGGSYFTKKDKNKLEKNM